MVHATPQKPFYFTEFNECIYCGSADDLTDEHIVPFSIGGNHILSKASCKSCAKITSAFELDITRGLWGDPRHIFRERSRHKKASETAVQSLQKTTSGFVFYRMPPPTILESPPFLGDISPLWTLDVFNAHRRGEENQLVDGLTLKFKHSPDSFIKMFIKIAYCNALTLLPKRLFKDNYGKLLILPEAVLTPLIGEETARSLVSHDAQYSLQTGLTLPHHGAFIVTDVTLYAQLGCPTYNVIVGTVENKNIDDALRFLGAGDASRAVLRRELF
ncbi:HNH endonuclease [Loktanella salsilacus]|uniref:HNH endonuclease n=1 Tax=Loktanella salsilacus TaxID=195913 RepID=UPI00356A29E0